MYFILVEKKQNTCCCAEIEKLKKIIKSIDEQILTQIIINNTNQIKVCTVLENMGKKTSKLLESNKRTHSIAFPLPKSQHHLLNYYQ